MIRPKYPKNALRNGIGGKVEVRAAVAPSGEIDELTVVNSESEFSAGAIKAFDNGGLRSNSPPSPSFSGYSP
jgi:TonB family protein